MPKPRKQAKLKPLKTLKIFCEGEKTEPNYLNGYIDTLPSQGRQSVVEVTPTQKNTAIQLVEEAIKAKKSPNSLPDDEFWVVYDRESVAKYSDAQHAKAYDKAVGSGINMAICNVCFEYWLLLHFVTTDAPYQNYDDLKKNSQLNAEVFKISGRNYEKSSSTIFSEVKDLVADARKRADRLNKSGILNAENGKCRPYHINPYVGIIDLLNAIDDFDKTKINDDDIV